MGWDEVWRDASNQHGLIIFEQIWEHGISRQQLRTARRHGILLPWGSPPSRKVLRVAGVKPSRRQAILAACFEAGPDAAASHSSADWLWALELPGAFSVEITVPRGRLPRLSGAKVHTSALLPADDITRLDGIPVTSVARTLVDCSARHSEATLGTAFRRARRRRLVTPAELEACRARLRYTTGWERTRRPDRIVEIEQGRDPGGSDKELDLHALVRGAGYPPPEFQIKIEVAGRTYYIDGGWPGYFVGYEYDGGHHSDPESFHYDRERLALIHAYTPWRIFCFTSESTRSFVVDTLGTALRERGWLPEAA